MRTALALALVVVLGCSDESGGSAAGTGGAGSGTSTTGGGGDDGQAGGGGGGASPGSGGAGGSSTSSGPSTDLVTLESEGYYMDYGSPHGTLTVRGTFDDGALWEASAAFEPY